MHVITNLKITLFKGVVIQTCQGTVEAKGLLLLGTNDLQSKAYILNMNYHNGVCGCSTCLEEEDMWHKERGTLAIIQQSNCGKNRRKFPCGWTESCQWRKSGWSLILLFSLTNLLNTVKIRHFHLTITHP